MGPENQSEEFLDATAILAADDLVYEDIYVKEWGGKVRLRALSSEERDAFEASMWVTEADPKNPKKSVTRRALTNGRARLVSNCLIYATGPYAGQRMFKDDAAVMRLGKKSGTALDKCFDVCVRLSGLSQEAQAELGKDSGGTPSDDSSSASLDS